MVVRPHCQQNKFPGNASQSTKPPPFKFDNPLSNLDSYVIDRLFLLFKYRTLKCQILISLSYHITEVVSIIVSDRSPAALQLCSSADLQPCSQASIKMLIPEQDGKIVERIMQK